MKAVILAAGKGERLGQLTQSIPKPMIQINRKPIIQYNIELCQLFGITDIFINLFHLGHVIENYLGNGSRFNVNITYSYENKLWGTAGAIRKIAETFWGFKSRKTKSLEPFYVIYGDNLSNYNLISLKDKSELTGSIASIGFHYREDVTSSGVAEFDETGRIISFIEKPKQGETNSKWVNAGLYYFRPEILNFIPCGYSDFSKDIFPLLLNKGKPIYGVINDSDVKAFDTPEMLFQNKQRL
jgi:NDP-sugar pyrophosphorylase family protein